MGWGTAIAVGFLVGQHVYHRLFDEKPKPLRAFDIPINVDGSTLAKVYGRCRVRQPFLAAAGPAVVANPGDGQYGNPAPAFIYGMNYMFFIIGFAFEDGTNRIYKLWVGDLLLEKYVNTPVGIATWPAVELSDLVGDGNFESQEVPARQSTRGIDAHDQGVWIEGEVEFLNGNEDQTLVDPTTFAATTQAGEAMLAAGIDGNLIPGYRGKMCALLRRTWDSRHDNGVYTLGTIAGTIDGWAIGATPQCGAVSFEVSSYPNFDFLASAPVDAGGGALEANPAAVIVDLLINKRSGLGIPVSRIDIVGSFTSAVATLFVEGYGYSRSIEDGANASDTIMDICRQIDAIVYEDPSDLKIKIKLVRGDYDPATVPVVTIDNCERVYDYAIGGKTNVPNKIRVMFFDRELGYQENSATAHNTANAIGQDGLVREEKLQFPGVCTREQAELIAGRELAYRGRSISKCRVVVDRSFYSIVPGDVVALTWPEYGIDGKLFRVGDVERGLLADGKITLSLIQDVFFAHRGVVVTTATPVGFPVDAAS